MTLPKQRQGIGGKRLLISKNKVKRFRSISPRRSLAQGGYASFVDALKQDESTYDSQNHGLCQDPLLRRTMHGACGKGP